MKQFFGSLVLFVVLVLIIFLIAFQGRVKEYFHLNKVTITPLAIKYDVGITIDDLPAAGDNPTFTTRTEIAKKIIQTLKDYDIPDPYGFSIGVLIQEQSERYEIMKMWADANYKIGNHTFHHYDYTNIPSKEFIQDIEMNEAWLTDYAKTIQELKVFRFPYLSEGNTLEKRYEVRSYLKKRNYKIAQVTLETFDWNFNEAYVRCMNQGNKIEAQKVVDLYLSDFEKNIQYSTHLPKFLYGNKVHIPQILLLHFNLLTADTLHLIFDKLLADGFAFHPALQEINDPLFQEDPAVPMAVGSLFYNQISLSRKLNYDEYKSPLLPKADLLDPLCANKSGKSSASNYQFSSEVHYNN